MLADYILAGWMLIIGLAEAAHLSAVFLGRSFSECVSIFVAELVCMCVLLACWMLIRYNKQKKDASWQKQREQQRVRKRLQGAEHTTLRYAMCGAIALLAVLQLATVTAGQQIYIDGDMTIEQVNSFLATDQVYQINPLTGQAYQQGMPLRLRILCLPTFYGILSRIFSLSAIEVVWQLIPGVVLLLSYLAYWSVAKALFSQDSEKQRLQRLGFLLLAIILISVSNYAYGMDGFGLLYGAFRGTSIRNGVLIPWLFGALLRQKKWPILLCVAAEACMVWTLYGMGACLAVALLWYLIRWIFPQISRKFPGCSGAEEGDACRNF